MPTDSSLWIRLLLVSRSECPRDTSKLLPGTLSTFLSVSGSSHTRTKKESTWSCWRWSPVFFNPCRYGSGFSSGDHLAWKAWTTCCGLTPADRIRFQGLWFTLGDLQTWEKARLCSRRWFCEPRSMSGALDTRALFGLKSSSINSTGIAALL